MPLRQKGSSHRQARERVPRERAAGVAKWPVMKEETAQLHAT